jgi:ribonuclease inhibitor
MNLNLIRKESMTNKLLENRRLRKKLKKMIDNMNEIVLYGEEMKENPHEYIKEKLDFPDYYGENLDALFDCLTEMDNKIIIIKDSALLDEDMISTFKDASVENPDLKLILD